MDASLLVFIRQFVAVVAAALAAVFLVALLTIPYALTAPNRVDRSGPMTERHMT